MATSPALIQQEARDRAKALFRGSPSFRSLSLPEQQALYAETVRAFALDLAEGNGARAVAMGTKGASKLIDEERHKSERFDDLGETAAEFVEAVDFPKFVRDLLKGVFDANNEVHLKQIETYINFLKAATASISKFVNAIDDTAAFGYLAENKSEDFGIDFDDEKKDQMVLKDKEGQVVAKQGEDIGDNQVKAKIMDAKIAMAREQRAMLREAILMGMNRLVIEKGNVKASVLFDFKAKERIEKADKAARRKETSKSSSLGTNTGIIHSLFHSASAGTTKTTREAEISVSSAKSLNEATLEGKLTGSVDITFKSDYFKLDNFAAMYGPVTREGAVGPGATPAGALPAGAPAKA